MGEIEVDEEEFSKLYVCKFGGLFEVWEGGIGVFG